MKKNKITVVIICRNEEDVIRYCLNSLVKTIKVSEYDYEVIFVDSNSEDQTLSIIREYKKILPLKIINITFASRYSAALARKIGSENSDSNSEFILFLDGDMELTPSFVDTALPKILNEKNVVGVIGKRNDISIASNEVIKNFYKVSEERIALHFGGAILLNKSALLKTGNYNESFFSNEEPDLYLRLKKQHNYVKEIPIEMINHYEKKNMKTKIINLLKSDRLCGVGQSYLESLKKGYFFEGFKHLATRFNFVSLTIDCISLVLFLGILASVKISLCLIILFQMSLFFYSCKNYTLKKFFIGKLYFLGLIKYIPKKSKVNYQISVEA